MSQRTKVGQWSKHGGWKSMKALPAAKAFSGRSNRSNRSDATPGSDETELPLLMSRCPSFSEKSRSVASRRSVDFPACPMLSLLLRVHLSDRIHVATSKRMQNETKCHQVDVKTISQNLVISKILLALVVLVNLVPFSSCWYCWSNRVEAWSFSPMPGIKERLTGFDGLQGERWGCQPRCRWFAKDVWITCITDLQKVLEFLQAWNWLFLKALLSPQQSSAKGALPAVSRYDWFALQDSTVTEVSWVYVAIIWQSYCQAIYIYSRYHNTARCAVTSKERQQQQT